ncbi:hypothetical protein A2415_02010 [candidate division WWE3 bacterium RIFOXYC1_FULL_39_7]|uniref:Acyl carrier protein n=2 Tax=Katanobacteria TaxID=422282 RepID=A0A1F4XAM8_UNCKA|nr:MAG: hypothetical protein A2415_02010 [candidate division WWE3 bacterium RIFOXYC1_FULL_39_7]OGC78123.1 MAG: hypothetical protein A2619_05225 [candidate division WWE3 bacterium RIFOXYD1_FULL_39_9]
MSESSRKIFKIIAERTGHEHEELNESSYFEDDLNIGEMELMEILTEIEEKLQVDVISEKDNIETVGDLIDLVDEQLE